MAKDDYDDMDEIDFGDDFNMDEAGLDSAQLEGRNPISRITTRSGRAFLDATAGNSAVRQKFVEDALPKEYQHTYRTAGQIKDEVDKTLDHLDKELRDTKKDAKVAARAVLPMITPFLPASMTKKVKDWSAEENGWRGGDVDPDTAEIQAALDGVFGGPAAPTTPQEQLTNNLETTADMLQEQAKVVKQDSMLQHIINMDDGLRGLVEAQPGVVNYRRKMLELQYRQYFTARDTLKAHGEAYEKIIPSLEAIAKNTALPDYAKEEFGEITSALMKRNIIEKLSPMNWARNYYKYVGEGFRNKISEMAGNARQAFSMASMAGGSNFDDGEDKELTSQQITENYKNQAATVAGGVAGGFFNNKVIDPAARWTQKQLLKSPKFMRLFGSITSAMNNGGAFVNSINADSEDTNIFLKGLRKAIDWAGVRGPDDMDTLNIQDETAATLGKVGMLTRKTIRAIDHVIPGLLAKIDQSVRQIRNPKAALEMYDYEADKFTTVVAWQKRAIANAQQDSVSSSLNNAVDGFLGSIKRSNKASETGIDALSDTARDIIKKAIEVATKNKFFIFDPNQLGSKSPTPYNLDHRLLAEFSEKEVDLLVGAFKHIFTEATRGMSENMAEGRIESLKTDFNSRAMGHHAANNGAAAKIVNDYLSIYGKGVVVASDLVSVKTNVKKTRPDYYLGKILVIRADWFAKGAYLSNGIPLRTLRDVDAAIYGPYANDTDPHGQKRILVRVDQFPYLTTKEGQHFDHVERSLDFSDGSTVRLNSELNGTSQLDYVKKAREGEEREQEILGSEYAKQTRDASTVDVGEEGEQSQLTPKQQRNRFNHRQEKKNQQKAIGGEVNNIKSLTIAADMKPTEYRLDMILSQLVANNVSNQLQEIKATIEESSMVVLSSITLDPKIREKIEAMRSKAGKAKSWLSEKGTSTRKWFGTQWDGASKWLKDKNISLNPFKAVTHAVSTGFNTAIEFGKGILGKRDILDELGNVVLSALDIQSKRLYTKDANGNWKLITQISDIKGGVWRLDVDGTTYNQVFSVDEIAAKYDKLRYHTATGFKKVVVDTGGWIGDRVRKLHARGMEIVRKGSGFASWATKSAWGAMAYLPDLYYSLDPEPRSPRLLARVVKEDGYIDVKTGKPIRYFGDIHGTIKDIAGNVVISQQEFENPEAKFIDAEGNDVTGFFTSIASTFRAARQKALGAGKAVYGWFQKAAELTKDFGGKLLGFFGGLLGKGGLVLGQQLVVERLEHIYRLLNARLSGGGNDTPLPFEPMKSSSGGIFGWGGKKEKPEEKNAKGDVEQEADAAEKTMMDRLREASRDRKYQDIHELGKEVFTKASKAATDKVAEKASVARQAISRATGKAADTASLHFGFDVKDAVNKMYESAGKTKDELMAETGLNAYQLNLALWSGEFKNLQDKFKKGVIDEKGYREALAELAKNSPHKEVFDKTTGMFTEKGKKWYTAGANKLAAKWEDAKARKDAFIDKHESLKNVAKWAKSSRVASLDVETFIKDYIDDNTKGFPKPKDIAKKIGVVKDLLLKHNETSPVDRDEEWNKRKDELTQQFEKLTAALGTATVRQNALRVWHGVKNGTTDIGSRIAQAAGKYLTTAHDKMVWNSPKKLKDEIAKLDSEIEKHRLVDITLQDTEDWITKKHQLDAKREEYYERLTHLNKVAEAKANGTKYTPRSTGRFDWMKKKTSDVIADNIKRLRKIRTNALKDAQKVVKDQLEKYRVELSNLLIAKDKAEQANDSPEYASLQASSQVIDKKVATCTNDSYTIDGLIGLKGKFGPEDVEAYNSIVAKYLGPMYSQRTGSLKEKFTPYTSRLGSWLSDKHKENRTAKPGSWRHKLGKGVDWLTAKTSIDRDGDGDRDGSYEDSRLEKLKKKASEWANKSIGDSIRDGFAKGKEHGGKIFKKSDEPSAIGALFEKLAPGLSSLLKTIFFGKFGLITCITKLGSVVKNVVGILASGAGKLAMTALRATGSAIGISGAGIGAAASYVGGLVAGAVTLPGLAIAAGVAVTGWALYAGGKYLLSDKLPLISQLRLASYGAEDYKRMDQKDAPMTLMIEDYVSKFVKYDKFGMASISAIPGKAIFQIIQGCDIDTNDNEAVNRFNTWFNNRFLPVYLKWLSVTKMFLGIDKLKGINEDKNDKFTKENLYKVVQGTRMSKDDPVLRITQGPYNDPDLLGYEEIEDLYRDADAKWKPVDKNKDRKMTDEEKEERDELIKKGLVPAELKDVTEFEVKDRTSWYKLWGAGNADELDSKEVFSSTVENTFGYIPEDDGYRHATDTMDTLTVVRMRMYGAWDITTRNVNMAFALEDMVYPKLKTEDGKLVYTGELAPLYEKLRGMGGFPKFYSESKFSGWFHEVFMPLFTAFIGAVNVHLKAKDPFKLAWNGGSKGFLIARTMWAVERPDGMYGPFVNEKIDTYGLALDYLEAGMASLERAMKAIKIKEEATAKALMPNAPTAAQAKVLEASSGKYTLNDKGELVLTKKGQGMKNSALPLKDLKTDNVNKPGGMPTGSNPSPMAPMPGDRADTGAPSSFGGSTQSDADLNAGAPTSIVPAPKSPKREVAERLLINAALKAGITDPTEIAMLLAQAAHESGNFSSVEENLNYRAPRLLDVFGKYFSPASAQKAAGKPVVIANTVYGNRMGNDTPGDGYKYRGRGFMQLTGKNNYDALAKIYPEAKDPNWVSTPEGAAASAVGYWTKIAKSGLREAAQAGDLVAATKIINNGTNGLDDRRNRFGEYMQLIKSGELDIQSQPAADESAEVEESPVASASAEVEESPVASASETPDAVDPVAAPVANGLSVMSAGAGADVVTQTTVSKEVAKVPDRPTGTPEATTAAAASTAATAAVSAVAVPPSLAVPKSTPVKAPPIAQIEREVASTRKRSEDHALSSPMGELVEVARAQLEAQKQILQALLSRGGAAASGAAFAPITMKR